MSHKAGYAIGTLKTGRNPYNASRRLTYPDTDNAQAIYSKYGVTDASTEDLKI
jgi:hypothetical protein